ncbi:MAG: response regulator [Chitinophagaceae bacterium]|nr:response regulator [Chitinophagaceae bacterium]
MSYGNYILCVDDDQDDCTFLSEALKFLNGSVKLHFEPSGAKALQFLAQRIDKREFPRMMVIDLNMPGMDGKETIDRVRQLKDLTGMPILVLSTTVHDPDILELEKSGVTIFAKPSSARDYEQIAKTIVHTMIRDQTHSD